MVARLEEGQEVEAENVNQLTACRLQVAGQTSCKLKSELHMFITQQPQSGNCLFGCNNMKCNKNLPEKRSIKRAKYASTKQAEMAAERECSGREQKQAQRASAQVAESSNDGHLS